MHPKSGLLLPENNHPLKAIALTDLLKSSLQAELGNSRRATKTVMRWTGVSDKAARLWINGATNPSGIHLVNIMKNSPSTAIKVLELSGYQEVSLTLELRQIETSLHLALSKMRALHSI